MTDGTSKDISFGSAAASTAPHVPHMEQSSATFGWRPLNDEFATFMTDGRPCRSCLHLRNAQGHAPRLCLHVLQSRSRLVITHACDLHATGGILVGQYIASYARQSLYQLSSTPPEGLVTDAFQPAAGVAVLFQKCGRRRLTVFGVFDGAGSPMNHVIDAREI